MSICKFEEFNKIIKELPKKIISVTLFIKEYDEKFRWKYERNCIIFFKNYKEYFPEHHLVLFTDRTYVKSETIESIIKESDITIVEYSCKDLIDKGTKEHKGMIGTIMRFYPLFSEEYREIQEIIVTEIDIYMSMI